MQKKNTFCGPGCECQGCLNLPISNNATNDNHDTDNSDNDEDSDADEESDKEDDGNDSNDEFLETEVVTDYFD